MPWTKTDYPASLKNMTPATREKAIEIANELLDQYEEGRAIRIATAQAKEWANDRNIDIWADGEPEGRDLHVVPHEGAWAIRAEKAEKVTDTFDSRDEAVDRACTIAGSHEAHVVIHDDQGKIRDVVEP